MFGWLSRLVKRKPTPLDNDRKPRYPIGTRMVLKNPDGTFGVYTYMKAGEDIKVGGK